MLASLVLALNNYTRRQMGYANRCFNFIDILAARAARPGPGGAGGRAAARRLRVPARPADASGDDRSTDLPSDRRRTAQADDADV